MKEKRKLDAREASLSALLRIEEEGAYANLALSEVLSAPMDPRDKRLAAEITYGVITYRLTLDWIVEQVAGRPVHKIDRTVLQALRIGLYQLFYLERVPPSAAVHATVEAIKKGKKRGLAPFVNGVLRGAQRKKNDLPWPERSRDEAAYLSLRYSHPEWLVRRWLGRFGPADTERLLGANNRPAPLSVRVNTLKTDRETLMASLLREGIEAHPSDAVPDGVVMKAAGLLTSLSGYRQGHFQVQGESAMLTTLILDPGPGSRVLDGCSAPGGKTTHMAALMGNSGEILALDIHPHRLELVKANCRRLGVENVQTKCLDARELDPDKTGEFDAILLDVPCSGFGVIRRKPDMKWRRKEEDIVELADTQKAMLNAAASVLKRGGVLVYSTCTNEPEETESVIAGFLGKHPDFVTADVRPRLPENWRDSAGEKGIQLYPHVHGVDGFFIARLRRL